MRRITPAVIAAAVARAMAFAGDKPGETTTRGVANTHNNGPNMAPQTGVPNRLRRVSRRRKGERK